jgi:MYXO-CTERM domain-containing protein
MTMNQTSLLGRASFISGVALALSAIASTATAGPPPLTEEELFEQAVIVADVRSTALECVGPAEEQGEGIIVSHYLSSLEIVEVIKAPEGMDETALDYHEYAYEYPEEWGEPSCSDPEVVLPAGWAGRVYLTGSPGNYQVFDFGGAVEDTAESAPSEVPQCELESPEEPPPVEDPPVTPADPEDPTTPAPQDSVEVGGCNMGGSSGTPWLTLGLVGLGFVAARRRR